MTHLSIRIDFELESKIQRATQILTSRAEAPLTKTDAARAALKRGLDAIIEEEDAKKARK